MKLLFDENLFPKLARLLADLFPDSVHVRDVGLKAADDSVVWKYAQDNTFDHLLEGFRPAPAKFPVGISSESCVGTIG
ncbi:MAG TPA: DUF5615 family PIN-like protein [Pyrinomonadaceae bacterium]|nr:DUF5615 family PIN-like protein [Pyrinomonadaceae bacterium]